MKNLEFYRPVASNRDTTKDKQPTRPTKKFKCASCNKASFKSVEAVEQHQAALGHDGPISQTKNNKKPTKTLLKQQNSGVKIPPEARSQPKATAAVTAIPSHNPTPLTQHPSVTGGVNDLIAGMAIPTN